MDRTTLQRKTYYAKSPEEAARLAGQSFGIQDEFSLFNFYRHVYLPTVHNRSKNWLNQIAWTMDRYVLPEFGECDVREIKRAELQRFFNRVSIHLKTSTVAKMKIVLSGVFRLAIADEIIQSNPTAFVRLREPERVRKTALTLFELQQLVSLSPDLVKPFVILAGCCGLRKGEAIGVTRSAISRDGVLSVRQQIQQYVGGCEISQKLKTEHSYRDIPLPPGLVELLLNCNQASDIWICSNTIGGFITPNNIQRDLKLACEAADVPKVTPHELRHTFISLMDNEVEAPRTVVMSLAGHAPQSTTDGYSHVKNEQKFRWMERYWDQISTVCSPESWATRA